VPEREPREGQKNCSGTYGLKAAGARKGMTGVARLRRRIDKILGCPRLLRKKSKGEKVRQPRPFDTCFLDGQATFPAWKRYLREVGERVGPKRPRKLEHCQSPDDSSQDRLRTQEGSAAHRAGKGD